MYTHLRAPDRSHSTNSPVSFGREWSTLGSLANTDPSPVDSISVPADISDESGPTGWASGRDGSTQRVRPCDVDGEAAVAGYMAALGGVEFGVDTVAWLPPPQIHQPEEGSELPVLSVVEPSPFVSAPLLSSASSPFSLLRKPSSNIAVVVASKHRSPFGFVLGWSEQNLRKYFQQSFACEDTLTFG